MHEVLKTNRLDHLQSLSLESRSLGIEQVEELECKLASDQYDLESRARLLGFYSALRFFPERKAERKRFLPRLRRHILWLIEHEPRQALTGDCMSSFDPLFEPQLFRKAEGLWLKHCWADPNNTEILLHCALFYESAGDIDSALILAKKARRVKGRDKVLDAKIRFYRDFLKRAASRKPISLVLSRKGDLPVDP